MKKEKDLENIQAQMRKGSLEFAILLLISGQPIYAGDILKQLQEYELIVVEGTLYPLLNRLRTSEMVDYEWKESQSGPPRKYYFLTVKGKRFLEHLLEAWKGLNTSINSLISHYEQNR